MRPVPGPDQHAGHRWVRQGVGQADGLAGPARRPVQEGEGARPLQIGLAARRAPGAEQAPLLRPARISRAALSQAPLARVGKVEALFAPQDIDELLALTEKLDERAAFVKIIGSYPVAAI